MAAPAKFLFDTDFAAPDRTREKAASAAEIAQKVAEAEARAYQDGFAAGQREAKAESDRRVALKSANEEVRAFFLGNMSSRAGKMLLDDMAALGPVRLRDVDEAQAAIVLLAKDMAGQGQIILQDGGAEEMVQ